MKLALATGNRKKLVELQRALAGLGAELRVASELGVTRFPPEEGGSYEENALLKAAFIASETGLPSLADDSGLEVAALKGAPGVYSARFGGVLTDGERIAYLLKKLTRVPRGERQARFVSVIVLATPGGGVYSFEGVCEGEILEGPRGEGGFGYDPVFYSHDLGKSFGEAGAEEKDRVSHRARAIHAFSAWAATPEGQSALGDAALRPTGPETRWS